MKKKFVSYLVLAGAVFGLAIVGSCKDYEYDVLQDQINGLNGNTATDVTTLQNQLKALQNKVDAKLNNPSTTAQLSDSLTDIYKLLEKLTGLPSGSSVANLNAALNQINQKLAGASSIADVEDEIDDMKFLWSDSLYTAYTNAFYAKNLAKEDSARIDTLFDKLADVIAAQDTLVGRVELQDSLANLEARYKAADSILSDQIKDLYEQVENLRDSVSKLYVTEKKRITSLYVQGAMNPIFGSFALPMGIRSNILAAYAGNILAETEFPIYSDSEEKGALVDDSMAIKGGEYQYIDKALTKTKIKNKKAAAQTIAAGSITSTADDNAGRIFVTVNPNEVELDSTYKFSFVTSDGKTTPATIGEFVPSTEKLTFGWTRAASETGFYEAPVKVEDANVSALSPKFAVSKSELLDIAKNVVNGGLNLTGIAKAVYTLAQTQLDANALKVEWADSLGNHSVTSQYDVAVTAFQPLSFNAMTKLRDVNADFKFPTINPLSELSVTLPNDIHIDLSDISFSVDGISSNISFDAVNVTSSGDITITVNVPATTPGATGPDGDGNYTKTYTVDGLNTLIGDINTAFNGKIVTWQTDANAAINNVVAQIKGKVDSLIHDQLGAKLDTEINAMLAKVQTSINNSLGGYNSYIDQMNSLVGQINNLAEKFNPILGLDGSAFLAPWIMYKGTDGSFHPMSNDKNNPTVFKKGQGGIILYTTSFNAELLAPAYKKYVAVTMYETQKEDGSWKVSSKKTVTQAINKEYPEYYNVVMDGERYAIPFNPTEPGRYTIYYSAMDYSGFVAAERFYVVVEE